MRLHEPDVLFKLDEEEEQYVRGRLLDEGLGGRPERRTSPSALLLPHQLLASPMNTQALNNSQTNRG